MSIMSSSTWRLFICFFIFVFPVAGLIRYTDYSVSWLPSMAVSVVGGVLWLIFLAYLAWQYVFRPLQLSNRAKQLQQNGRPVTAKVVTVLPEASMAYASGGEVRVTFRNLSDTEVTVPFLQTQLQLMQSDLKEEQSFTLYLNPELRVPAFASPSLVAPKMVEQSGFYLFIFAVLYCLITAFVWFIVLDHQLTMSLAHPWIVTPVMGFLLLNWTSRFFNYNETLVKPEVSQLILVGKSAQAEVIQVKETGIERSESPEVKFTLRFTDDEGQSHTLQIKQIVKHTELYQMKGKLREIIYLPDNPKVVVFADQLGQARG